MDEHIEVKSMTHPRRSSDFCVLSSAMRDGKNYAIYGVLDTIGRPRRKYIKNVIATIRKKSAALVNDESICDLQGIASSFRDILCEANEMCREVYSRQSGFLGFCFAFAVRVDESLHVLWGGDCRAYSFIPTRSDANNSCRVRCLTSDNNSLDSRMREIHENDDSQEMQMLKSEMLELSRQLKLYLGMGHQEQFAKSLADQTVEINLAKGEALMLTTDGLIMPIIRHEVANAGFNLTLERLYLEEWFARYLANGEYFRDYQGMDIWDAMINDIKESCLKYTRQRRRYRDDMAVIHMYRP